MSGGIMREGTALAALRRSGPVMLLYSGGMVTGDSRQEVLKAHALAQTLGSWHVTACNLGLEGAKLDIGEVMTLARLTGNRMVTTSLRPSPTNPLPRGAESGGFYVFGVSTHADRIAENLGETAEPLSDAVAEGLTRASDLRERPVLLLDGDRALAAKEAEEHPEIAFVAYNSDSQPLLRLDRVGDTVLLTAGLHGQFFVSFSSGRCEVSKLTPSYRDDAETARLFGSYLRTVEREQLWAKTPRIAGPRFVGSEACASCHHESYAVWEKSGHARGYETLAHRGESADPECLPCHIVGGQYRTGFQTLERTPQLASVGCESCHGSGYLHAQQPRRYRLPKVLPATCDSCHTTLTSPSFNFKKYWPRVSHFH
jgi:hypothetical protein